MVLATVSFFALAVFGLGAVSVATDRDIISVRGLGPVPGAVGMLVAVIVFALVLAASLRRTPLTFLSVPAIALATTLAHLVAVWAGVAVGSGDLIVATAVVGDLIGGGASIVILAAAAIAAWGGIALRRTRAEHPRWPWGRDDEE
ncbi:hypothetical protein [Microbacterium sp. ISL-103]|uniref:hypothetical protein n=1 Tax=Microbacterium sp. ISL-103 TaxID=2819156 RepID=UPI0020364B9C|nr:hypothetical protein [Microbacterium sp. ISL-103]